MLLPAIGEFNRHRNSFVFFGLLFGVFNWLVLAPAFALLFTVMVRWGGGRVVTNDDILGFFLSPIGISATLVLLVSVMTTILTQQAGLMIVFANLRMHRPIGWVRALLATLSKFPGILLINIGRAIVVWLVVLPFVGLGAYIYHRFLTVHDLNYLVQVRPAVFWYGAIAATLLVTAASFCLLLVHTRVIFVFPAYFFGRLSPMAALRKSLALAKGHTLRLVWIFVVWIVAVGVLNTVLGVLLDRLGPMIVPLAGRKLTVVAIVVGTILVVNAVAHVALNVLTFGINAIAISRAYLLLAEGAELSLPADARSETAHFWRTHWPILAFGVAYLAGAYATAGGLFENLGLADSVAIIAHRGDSKKAPENTLAAIEQAVESGADYVEIDVQETRDGVVTVFHDTDFKRIAGFDAKIWEVTYEEIRELDVGSWFSSEFAGERIPTLADAISAADPWIPLIIEIKLTEHEQHLVKNVVQIIEDTGIESRCIVASLNRAALEEVESLNPRLKRGYLVYRTLGDMRDIDADYLMLEAGLATPLALKAAHDAGKQVYVWTVNSTTKMSFLIDRGVDGIMTDDPRKLVDVLEQRSELTDIERLVLRFAELVSR